MFFIPICAASDSGGMEFIMKENNNKFIKGYQPRCTQDGYQPKMEKRGYQLSSMFEGYQPSENKVNVSSANNPFSNQTTPIVMMKPAEGNNSQSSAQK